MKNRLYPCLFLALFFPLLTSCQEDTDPADSSPDWETGIDSSQDGNQADLSQGDSHENDEGELSGDMSDVVEHVLSLSFEELLLPYEFVTITDFSFIPGSDEFLLLEQNGTVHHLVDDSRCISSLGTFEIPANFLNLDCGLISLAFDPDFDTNGYFYLAHCNSWTHSQVTRFTFTPDDYSAIGESAAEIIVAGDDDALAPWHNVGSIGFDPDGSMWILFGEKTIPENSADLSNNLGTLLRIIPNRDPEGSGYTPDPDNPFIGVADASDDIFAYGLRSPWRGLLDHQGRYWVGDVGADSHEEINLITEPGQFFGWPYLEGPRCTIDDCSDLDAELPLISWTHEITEPLIFEDPLTEPTMGRVSYVGLEYEPNESDPYEGLMDNRVIYGDICLGWVRAMLLGDDNQIMEDGNIGHLANATGWSQAPDGYIYVSTYGDCESFGDDETIVPGKLLRAHLTSNLDPSAD